MNKIKSVKDNVIALARDDLPYIIDLRFFNMLKLQLITQLDYLIWEQLFDEYS